MLYLYQISAQSLESEKCFQNVCMYELHLGWALKRFFMDCYCSRALLSYWLLCSSVDVVYSCKIKNMNYPNWVILVLKKYF